MPGEGPLTGGGGVSTFKELSDTPASYSGQSGKTVTVKATEDALEYTTPAGGGDMLAATYDPASKAAQILVTSDIVTTIADPGLDTKVPSEQGVREALNAIDQKKIKATYFTTITSGTTSGTATKPAGAGADVDFIMDEWGTATDALVSTIENGKPTFKSPVNAGGSTITTTFDTSGNYTFSDTPSPAADHALIYVYTCYLKNFNVAEALWETELLDYVADHAPTHTDGSDDIQSATNAQKGLATAAHITAIEANTAHKTSDGSDHTFIDQDVTSGSSPTLDGANITNVDADTLIADVKEANVSAVKKGQPCADVGSSGTKFLVQLADCDNVNLIRLLGLSDADVVQNETGTVVHKGLLTNVNTQTTNSDLNPGAETWAAGEMLYVSQTPGGLTKIRPTSGRCIKACRSQKGNSASDTLLAIVHTNSICACAASGEDICSRMGDSAGANKHSFKDYANNEVAAIDSNGNLTLSGTASSKDAMSAEGSSPTIVLQNITEEDIEDGRESKFVFKGEQSGGEVSTLAEVYAAHKTAADDEIGKLILRVNNGAALADVLTLHAQGVPNAKLGNLGFSGDYPTVYFNAENSGTGQRFIQSDAAFCIWHDRSSDSLKIRYTVDGVAGELITFSDAFTITDAGLVKAKHGISNDHVVTIDDADVADDDYAKFTANGLEGRSVSEVRSDLKVENTKNIVIKVIADDTALTTGNGKAHFTVPIELNGMNLVSVGAHVYTVSSSGTPTFQIHNLTQTADMLSTVITIDANEKDSKDAATPAVIDGANDDVATGDELRFDCDVAGTGTKGMEIRMGFRLP